MGLTIDSAIKIKQGQGLFLPEQGQAIDSSLDEPIPAVPVTAVLARAVLWMIGVDSFAPSVRPALSYVAAASTVAFGCSMETTGELLGNGHENAPPNLGITTTIVSNDFSRFLTGSDYVSPYGNCEDYSGLRQDTPIYCLDGRNRPGECNVLTNEEEQAIRTALSLVGFEHYSGLSGINVEEVEDCEGVRGSISSNWEMTLCRQADGRDGAFVAYPLGNQPHYFRPLKIVVLHEIGHLISYKIGLDSEEFHEYESLVRNDYPDMPAHDVHESFANDFAYYRLAGESFIPAYGLAQSHYDWFRDNIFCGEEFENVSDEAQYLLARYYSYSRDFRTVTEFRDLLDRGRFPNTPLLSDAYAGIALYAARAERNCEVALNIAEAVRGDSYAWLAFGQYDLGLVYETCGTRQEAISFYQSYVAGRITDDFFYYGYNFNDPIVVGDALSRIGDLYYSETGSCDQALMAYQRFLAYADNHFVAPTLIPTAYWNSLTCAFQIGNCPLAVDILNEYIDFDGHNGSFSPRQQEVVAEILSVCEAPSVRP